MDRGFCFLFPNLMHRELWKSFRDRKEKAFLLISLSLESYPKQNTIHSQFHDSQAWCAGADGGIRSHPGTARASEQERLVWRRNIAPWVLVWPWAMRPREEEWPAASCSAGSPLPQRVCTPALIAEQLQTLVTRWTNTSVFWQNDLHSSQCFPKIHPASLPGWSIC